jgi:lactoylglutathione lyase
MVASSRVDHLAILVSSLEKSMPYYDALLPLLGMEKQRDHFWSDRGSFTLQFEEAAPGSQPYERLGPGMNHVGFAAPDPGLLLRVREEMARSGFPVPEVERLSGADALFMKDPDGIRFEITYYPPGPAAA